MKKIINHIIIFFLLSTISLILLYLTLGSSLLNEQYKNHIYNLMLNDDNYQYMVAYSKTIHSKPHQTLSFRFFSSHAKLLQKADITLNSNGLFSKNEYKIDNDEILTILVLGGEQTASSVVDISWPDYLQEILENHGFRSQVINCAWPDAGPLMYRRLWNGDIKDYGEQMKYFEKCSKFKPDLTLINFVDTDFYRAYAVTGTKLTYKNQDVYPTAALREMYGINYNFSYVGDEEPIDVSSKKAIISRPFGVFGKKNVIDNTENIANFQKDITRMIVNGVDVSHKEKINFFLDKLQGRVSKIIPKKYTKNFDAPDTFVSDEERIKMSMKPFSDLRNEIPNNVFIKSFNNPALVDNCSDVYSKFSIGLNKIDSDFKYIDSCPYALKKFNDKNKRYFMTPFMSEKFTDSGMRAYAEVVFDILKNNNYLN